MMFGWCGSGAVEACRGMLNPNPRAEVIRSMKSVCRYMVSYDIARLKINVKNVLWFEICSKRVEDIISLFDSMSSLRSDWVQRPPFCTQFSLMQQLLILSSLVSCSLLRTVLIFMVE